MPLFNKAAIVGVGLIGGSIALELKKKRLCREVVGVTRHKETLAQAKRSGIIDRGSLDLDIIRDADLVVLAASVGTILEVAEKLAPLVKKDCIVTDVGSTKQAIVKRLTKMFPGYIGSHPLAGSEKRGVYHARYGMFAGSLCILTPTKETRSGATAKIRKMWHAFGARVVSLPASRHDTILSLVSHLPHAVAFSLMSSVPAEFLPFAAGGLKDTTRLAASDATLWVDIFLSNRKNVLSAIGLLQGNLEKIKTAIRKQDRVALAKILKQAKKKRDTLT